MLRAVVVMAPTTRPPTYSAIVGSWSIGAFIEPGFRWMNDIGNHSYVSIGVVLRLPIGAGAVDVSGQH